MVFQESLNVVSRVIHGLINPVSRVAIHILSELAENISQPKFKMWKIESYTSHYLLMFVLLSTTLFTDIRKIKQNRA